jgi:hypothetical protein
MKTCVRKLFHNFDVYPTVGSKVRALSNRYSGLERRDLRLTEYRFHIYSKENNVRKLFYNLEVDPTVGSKVRALSNRYSCLERRDLRLTKWCFHIYSKENSVR